MIKYDYEKIDESEFLRGKKMEQIQSNFNGQLLSRDKIKIIALLSMLLDHIGAFIIYPMYVNACMVNGVEMMGELVPNNARIIYLIYMVCRIIGRLAFPIFSFMIVEGFLHTHNLRKYLCRLFLFAIISEIPYDLANTGTVLEISKQNVLWTFIIAIIMMWTLERIRTKIESNVKYILLTIIVISISALFAIFSDGGIGGILLIASMYLFHKKKTCYWIGCVLSLCVMSLQFMWIQLFAAVALILLEVYNGKKGKDYKYLFYIFYPAHLLILWFVSYIGFIG